MVARVLGRGRDCGPAVSLYVHHSHCVVITHFMTLAHIHLLLNHWPIIGAFVGLGLFVVALAANSDHLKQTSLGFFAFLALLTIPTYMSGDVANEVLKTNTPLPMELVDTHHGAALLALIFMEITGFAALIGLWQFSRM